MGIIVTLAIALPILVYLLSTSGIVADPRLFLSTDVEQQNQWTNVNWGTCYENTPNTKSGYVTNVGNVPLMIVVTHSNFTNPNAEPFFALTSNLNGTVIAVGEQLGMDFTVTPQIGAKAYTPFAFIISVNVYAPT
jgi:hypothetical protein